MSDILSTGTRFLDYRIERVIDKGGMGVVYEATELYSNDVVAIKCILPRHAARDDFARRFEIECKIYPVLKHQNIVRMRRAGVSPEGTPFIVMDFLRGLTLRRILTRVGRLSIPNALHVMLQVADAMLFAHKKEILHRDLKPENIMVGTEDVEKGHAWVLDFGIAKRIGSGPNTDELPMIGSARYLSPEQGRAILRPPKGGASKMSDARSDIYAFGVILYELLTGKHIFIDDNADPLPFEAAIAGHLTAEPTPVNELLIGCPTGVWTLIAKCIAIDPEARFASFAEVISAIRIELGSQLLSIPSDHPQARKKKEDEQRLARQVAFAAMPLEAAMKEEDEGARSSTAARSAKPVQSVTAELRDYVPSGNPLPFEQGRMSPVVVSRGKGQTDRLAVSVGPSSEAAPDTMPATTPVTTPTPDTTPSPGNSPPSSGSPYSGTMPLSAAAPSWTPAPAAAPMPAPVLLGKGHTIKIPRSSLPPSTLPIEATSAAGPASVPPTPPTADRTQAPSSMQPSSSSPTVTLPLHHLFLLVAGMGFFFVAMAVVLVISMRALPGVWSVEGAPTAPAQAPVPREVPPSSTPSALTTASAAPAPLSTAEVSVSPTPTSVSPTPTLKETTTPPVAVATPPVAVTPPPTASTAKPARAVVTGVKPKPVPTRFAPIFDDLPPLPPKGKR